MAKKVVGRTEWKDDRFAKLECGHSIKVSHREAMPYEADCPTCEPPAEASADAPAAQG